MKTYMIRVEKTQVGYYNIKCKSLEEAEAQAKATARESALAKLAALGLTADEVAAL